MAINLKKGQKVNLTKDNPGLSKIRIGIGWDSNLYDGGEQFDLDATVFLLNESKKANGDSDIVYYGNLNHVSNSVIHSGDNRTGAGDGDDEEIRVDLSLVPQNVSYIAVVGTIYDADVRRQNFGQVTNSYIRIINDETNEELIRYDLGEDYSIETAIVVAEIYRQGTEWKFNAVGSGFQGGLEAICVSYGLEA